MMHIPMSEPDSGSFYVGFKNRAVFDMKSFENLFLVTVVTGDDLKYSNIYMMR